MVLHIRVWESSSLPGFFFILFLRFSLCACTNNRLETHVPISNTIDKEPSDDGTARQSVGESGRRLDIFSKFLFVFSRLPSINPRPIKNYCPVVYLS